MLLRQEVSDCHDANSFVASQAQKMAVSGDDVVAISAHRAFENSVVIGILLDDIEARGGSDGLGASADLLANTGNVFVRPPEFSFQNIRNFVQDGVRHSQLDFARSRES